MIQNMNGNSNYNSSLNNNNNNNNMTYNENVIKINNTNNYPVYPIYNNNIQDNKNLMKTLEGETQLLHKANDPNSLNSLKLDIKKQVDNNINNRIHANELNFYVAKRSRRNLLEIYENSEQQNNFNKILKSR